MLSQYYVKQAGFPDSRYILGIILHQKSVIDNSITSKQKWNKEK